MAILTAIMREMPPRQYMFDSLPDELLIDIVSRLPFKEAARTCVLAKRWITLWRFTTNIEINQNFFIRDGANMSDVINFVNFSVNFLNTYRGRYISSFNLVMGETVVFLDRALLRQFVEVAASRHVKHLTVDLARPTWKQHGQPFSPTPVIDLPRKFYQHCHRYESLNLSGVEIRLSNCKNFAALLSVSLAWIQLEDEDLEKLVAESPCLEELRLVQCWGFDVEIRPNSLKTLVVNNCNLDQDAISVVAPKLKVFVYSGKFGDINFNNCMANLEEVYLDFNKEEDFDHTWNLIYDQLIQFKNVKVLQVCSFVLQILPFIFDNLLVVPKCLILKTAGFHPNDFQGLQYFLNSCKSVEELQIDITERRLLNDYESPMVFNPDLFWERGNGTPAECLESSLKVVQVKGFTGTKHQVQFLQLIMQLGKLLEKMVLHKKEGCQLETEKAYQLLSNCQKASSKLLVVYA